MKGLLSPPSFLASNNVPSPVSSSAPFDNIDTSLYSYESWSTGKTNESLNASTSPPSSTSTSSSPGFISINSGSTQHQFPSTATGSGTQSNTYQNESQMHQPTNSYWNPSLITRSSYYHQHHVIPSPHHSYSNWHIAAAVAVANYPPTILPNVSSLSHLRHQNSYTEMKYTRPLSLESNTFSNHTVNNQIYSIDSGAYTQMPSKCLSESPASVQFNCAPPFVDVNSSINNNDSGFDSPKALINNENIQSPSDLIESSTST